MREKVKLLRLLSGEELIGLADQTPTGWTLSYPMIVVTNLGMSTESVQVTFAPFCPAADTDRFEFSSLYVAFAAPVFDGLAVRYLSVMEFDKNPPATTTVKKRAVKKKPADDAPTQNIKFTKS